MVGCGVFGLVGLGVGFGVLVSVKRKKERNKINICDLEIKTTLNKVNKSIERVERTIIWLGLDLVPGDGRVCVLKLTHQTRSGLGENKKERKKSNLLVVIPAPVVLPTIVEPTPFKVKV